MTDLTKKRLALAEEAGVEVILLPGFDEDGNQCKYLEYFDHLNQRKKHWHPDKDLNQLAMVWEALECQLHLDCKIPQDEGYLASANVSDSWSDYSSVPNETGETIIEAFFEATYKYIEQLKIKE